LGNYLMSRPWLGRVTEVSLHVDVAFDDGVLYTLTGAMHKPVGAQAKEEDNYKYDL
jgi:ubiquitin-conjugating enzyme E2 O